MGYDLHITRAAQWTESEASPITVEEWLAVVEQDPELGLAGDNGPYFAIWRGQSEDSEQWLDWSHGRIHTKNPTEPLVDKMIELSAILKADVQGDDGELYREGWQKDYEFEAAGAGEAEE
jgi:hypothetical protein